MPLVENEQDVKQKSQFLKYEAGDGGNTLMLRSNMYQLETHFLKSVNRSVECRGAECLYCAAGYAINTEYHYMVDLNGEIGFMNIKPSVFFAIQQIAKAQKKNPRKISWTVIKKGEGLNTDYTVSKDDNLTDEDYEKLTDELEANNKKLEALMETQEEKLSANYATHISDIKGQEAPPKSKKAQPVEDEPETDTDVATRMKEKRNKDTEVDPEDVPF